MALPPEERVPEGWLDKLIDAIDGAIIRQLQVDGRTSHRRLAHDLEIPEATVRRRVNRLVDDGIIQIIAVLNTLASEETAFALIELSFIVPVQEIVDEIATWPEVTWIAETFGAASLIIEVVYSGRGSLRSLVRRLHRLDGLRGMRTSEYLSIRKTLYAGPPTDFSTGS